MSPRYARHFSGSAPIAASADTLFAYLDRHALLAKHMTDSSWMMGGGRMAITTDAGEGRALGSHIRMQGSAFGVPLFLDEVVIRYDPPSTKVWETVGSPRLFVIGNYRMGFHIAAENSGATLEVFIHYELPQRGAARALGALLAPVYAKWCVTSMVRDAQRQFAQASDVARAAAG
jgi:hypothetical protein